MTYLTPQTSDGKPFSLTDQDTLQARECLKHAELALLPGAHLVRLEKKKVVSCSHRAHQFLMDEVVLHPEFTLRDLFLLLDRDPVLVQVFRRVYAQEILAHVRPEIYKERKVPCYAPTGIQELELYGHWHKNSHTGELWGVGRLDCHGLGFELIEPLDEGYGCVYEAGTRITWGISMTDPIELLDCPVRVRPEVQVHESDVDACRYGEVVLEMPLPKPTLASIVQGVLYEMSFHGTPQQTQAFAESLRKQVDDLERGAAHAVEVDLDTLFYDDDQAEPLSAFIHRWAPLKTRAVKNALRRLPDSLPVEPALREALNTDLIEVLPAWKDAQCIDFRRALRIHESEERMRKLVAKKNARARRQTKVQPSE